MRWGGIEPPTSSTDASLRVESLCRLSYQRKAPVRLLAFRSACLETIETGASSDDARVLLHGAPLFRLGMN